MALLVRPVVLASGSPYRAQLLRESGVAFRVQVSDVDENLQPPDEPAAYARALAARKAGAVAAGADARELVVAADTVCALGREIIGKPADEADAERMIARACNAVLQRVITGVCVVDRRDGRALAFAVTSLVEMQPATPQAIAAYVATGEPMGKCGALCIESGQTFVKAWRGSYSNILGLPLEALLPLLCMLDAA
jgi:septum formation protein